MKSHGVGKGARTVPSNGGGEGVEGGSQCGVMSHPQRKASPTTSELKPPAKGEGGPVAEKESAAFFSKCQSSFYLKY